MSEIFSRTRLLAGDDMMNVAASTSVIVFGIGGVGSWCAEALVRSGIGAITLVDRDVIAESNINRQLPATTATVGRPKVEVLGERLLEINPRLRLTKIFDVYSPDNSDGYRLDDYDYVVDAIDSLTCKAHLILQATASRAKLVSSMGAARKLHASMIDVAEFWKVKGCPLARALRQWFKRHDVRPRRKFKCVYSPEVLPQLAAPEGANGTFAHTTAIAGLTLAGIIIEDIYAATR